MTNEIKYMEIDEIFMNHVASCGDPYQEKGSYLNDEIKNHFQKILHKIKPIKTFRPCSDYEMEKYHFSHNVDLCNTLEYEKCYIELLNQVKDKDTSTKIDYILPYIPYLRGILNPVSAATDDNKAFCRYRKNQSIAYLLVYRYEHGIAIINDLHMEFSKEAVDKYSSELSKRLALEHYQKIIDTKNNHPEEYQKIIDKNRKDFEYMISMLKKWQNDNTK